MTDVGTNILFGIDKKKWAKRYWCDHPSKFFVQLFLLNVINMKEIYNSFMFDVHDIT